jgi:succinate dehydrogenase / fumarate reductase membrane anchor subunit
MRRASGLRAWVVQRVSAVYLAFFSMWMLGVFVFNPPRDVGVWRAFVADPWVGVAAGLFFLALLLHAWVGVRDVVIDYVHPPAIRLPLLILLAAALTACGLWAARVLLLAALA